MPERPNRPFSKLLAADELAISDEAIAWFARLKSEHPSTADWLAFEAWRSRSPVHERAWTDVCELWNERDLHHAVSVVGSAASVRRSKKAVFRYWPQAAVLVALGLAAFVLLSPRDWIMLPQADHHTGAGEQRNIQFTDGSIATLNTRTAIATDWSPEARRTRLLTGEAFFAVEPEPRRPFVVDTEEAHVRAVGTKFVVLKRHDGVQVTVIEGIVEVVPTRREGAPTRLSAGQQVTIGPEGIGLLGTPDLGVATAWMRRRLMFDGTPLPDAVAEIGRYHNGRILLVGSVARRLKVSGIYDLSDTKYILHTLSRTLPLRRLDLTDRLVILY